MFNGNKDRDSIVYHKLNPPIQARYIRLRPTAWYGHISLRMELYGCPGITQYYLITATFFLNISVYNPSHIFAPRDSPKVFDIMSSSVILR